MRIFRCDHCQQLAFFENSQCMKCGHLLAFLPDLGVVGSLEPTRDGDWRSPMHGAHSRYRLCVNFADHNVCNWALGSDEQASLCQSCRLTRVIPDLNFDGHKEAWYRLETAKRRLLYGLRTLGLPTKSKFDDPQHGLAFDFLANGPDGKVLTGHNNGVITVNIAEADDAERERRRNALNEPYRTLLGHFRHEIGHYYWDRLLKNSNRLDAFRALFGDERVSYTEGLRLHHQQGPPGDWQQRFVSAYASAHPWEDWAETWAHYLHMTDALETAAACGLSLQPPRSDEPALENNPRGRRPALFEKMIDDWFALTYVLNNLNRGMGLPDGYPFVLAAPAIEKIKFVHETVAAP